MPKKKKTFGIKLIQFNCRVFGSCFEYFIHISWKEKFCRLKWFTSDVIQLYESHFGFCSDDRSSFTFYLTKILQIKISRDKKIGREKVYGVPNNTPRVTGHSGFIEFSFPNVYYIYLFFRNVWVTIEIIFSNSEKLRGKRENNEDDTVNIYEKQKKKK